MSGASAQATPRLLELPDEGCSLDDVLGELERRLLVQALERSGGLRTNAAKLLGVSTRSLRYRLQKHSLADDSVDSEVESSEPSPPNERRDPS